MPLGHTLRLQMMEDAACLAQAKAAAHFWHDRLVEKAEEQHRTDSAAIAERHEKDLSKLRSTYEQAIALAASQALTLSQSAGIAAAPWNDPLWQTWIPNRKAVPPDCLRVGDFTIESALGRIAVPALVSLAGGCNLVIKASGAARTRAALAFQSLFLRLLALSPPGQLRLLLIDPSGMMPKVASFMQLADYDPLLVTGKVWTEMVHVEQRITQVLEQMPDVGSPLASFPLAESIRSDTASRGSAPHVMLVMLGVPFDYSPRAFEGLLAIVRRGPQHGFYTFLLLDSDESAHSDVDFGELDQHATVVNWNGQIGRAHV